MLQTGDRVKVKYCEVLCTRPSDYFKQHLDGKTGVIVGESMQGKCYLVRYDEPQRYHGAQNLREYFAACELETIS